MSEEGLRALRAMVEDITSKPQYGDEMLSRMALANLIYRSIDRALATQPEPGAVPELPEFVAQDDDGNWIVHLKDDRIEVIYGRSTPDDLDRIAEACTKLAARERARRAGS